MIAAANPIGGRYDASRTLAENVELTDPILQRFDILCVVRDCIDPLIDERLARFVTESHMQSVPYSDYTPDEGNSEEKEAEGAQASEQTSKIPQELLRKYIWYARTQCHPNLHDVNKEKIVQLYSELRQQSARSGGVPIAVRHIESIIRISEAHARMHLRDHVRDDDVDVAIRVMLESFISAQKHGVMQQMRSKFRKYLEYQKGTQVLLMHLLEQMMREKKTQQDRLDEDSTNYRLTESIRISLDDFNGRANEMQIFMKHTEDFFASADFIRSFQINKEAKMIEKLF